MSASEEKALKTKTMADSDELISPVVSNAPEFVITRASVNAEPAELDGKPISREEQEHKNHAASPEHEELRQELISVRKHDPAVLVDIPQTPQAEELLTLGAEASAKS